MKIMTVKNGTQIVREMTEEEEKAYNEVVITESYEKEDRLPQNEE